MPQVPNPTPRPPKSMSMVCSPSPSPASPQHHAPAPALDLLDDNWFFSNTLANNKPPRSPSTGACRRMSNKGLRRLLLRTPSLPSPRRLVEEEEEEEEDDGALATAAANNQQQQQHQFVVDADDDLVDDGDLNWSSIYEGILRARMAGRGRPALQRAPSMPVVPSDGRHGQQTDNRSTPSMPRLRHSYSTLQERHTAAAAAKQQHQHQQKKQQPGPKKNASGGCFPFQQQDRKWKSWSDIDESMEVQGFRDLGFVFDKEELRESLADVLPGLKHPHHAAQMRQQRPALQVRRVQSSSSAAEMKDQLRMWAQSVACNVRQDSGVLIH